MSKPHEPDPNTEPEEYLKAKKREWMDYYQENHDFPYDLADQYSDDMAKADLKNEGGGSRACWAVASLHEGFAQRGQENTKAYDAITHDLHHLLKEIGVTKIGFKIGGLAYLSLKTEKRVNNIILAAKAQDATFAGWFGKKAINGFHALLSIADKFIQPTEPTKKFTEDVLPLRTNLIGKPIPLNALSTEQKICRMIFSSRSRMTI